MNYALRRQVPTPESICAEILALPGLVDVDVQKIPDRNVLVWKMTYLCRYPLHMGRGYLYGAFSTGQPTATIPAREAAERLRNQALYQARKKYEAMVRVDQGEPVFHHAKTRILAVLRWLATR